MDVRESHYQGLRAVFLAAAQTLLPRRHNHLWEVTIASGELEPKKKWTYLMDGLGLVVRLGFPPEDVGKVDALLATHDQPRLSDLQQRWSRDYRRIVRAGKIRNEEEYSLIATILESAKPIHPVEKCDLLRMLTEYEKPA